MSNSNKVKGSFAERYYAKFFREMGFSHCITSRQGSRQMDNAKIDLIFVPFNIQIKAGIQKNLNPGKELFQMDSCIKTMFPSEDDVHNKPCILIHHKQGVPGKVRKEDLQLVYMSSYQFNKFEEDFETSITQYSYKEFKSKVDFPFKIIIGITFEEFKNKILIKYLKN